MTKTTTTTRFTKGETVRCTGGKTWEVLLHEVDCQVHVIRRRGAAWRGWRRGYETATLHPTKLVRVAEETETADDRVYVQHNGRWRLARLVEFRGETIVVRYWVGERKYEREIDIDEATTQRPW